MHESLNVSGACVRRVSRLGFVGTHCCVAMRESLNASGACVRRVSRLGFVWRHCCAATRESPNVSGTCVRRVVILDFVCRHCCATLQPAIWQGCTQQEIPPGRQDFQCMKVPTCQAHVWGVSPYLALSGNIAAQKPSKNKPFVQYLGSVTASCEPSGG